MLERYVLGTDAAFGQPGLSQAEARFRDAETTATRCISRSEELIMAIGSKSTVTIDIRNLSSGRPGVQTFEEN